MNCLTAFTDSALVISSSTHSRETDREGGLEKREREREREGGGGGGERDRQTDRQTEPNETQCRF